MFDVAKPRSGGKIVLERFDLRRRTFGQSFDATVRKILYIADYLMTSGGALHKETKADTLHVAADEETARNSSRMCRSI